MKKSLLAAVLLSAGMFSAAHAQQMKGFHAGLNTGIYYNYVVDKGMSDSPAYDYDMGEAWRWAPIGLTLGYQWSSGVGIQTEFNSMKHGQRWKIMGEVDEKKQEIGVKDLDMTAFQIPLLLKVTEGSGKAKFSFVIGPYLSIVRDLTEKNTFSKRTFSFSNTEVNPIIGNAEINLDQLSANSRLEGEVAAYSSKTGVEAIYKGTGIGALVGLGTDIYATDNLYFSAQFRINYQFTEMREENKNLDLSAEPRSDYKYVDQVSYQTISSTGTKPVVKDLADIENRTLLFGGFQISANYLFGK